MLNHIMTEFKQNKRKLRKMLNKGPFKFYLKIRHYSGICLFVCFGFCFAFVLFCFVSFNFVLFCCCCCFKSNVFFFLSFF